jgi:uncharacterized protein YecA (UPF0149 family)
LHYVDGDKLGWFYAVYVSDEISHVLPNGFWNSQETSSIIQLQLNQRQKILDANANYLRQVKEKFISRNNPCPCGSGKKYKHCHGS